MLEIQIIQVSKTKKDYYEKAIQEYLKRLSSTIKLKVITIKEANSKSIPEIKQSEANSILEKTPKNSFIIALSEEGKQFSSIEFSKFIEIKMQNFSSITFIIGGTFGLDEKVKARANHIMSFSSMTFTHEMIRVLLLEQIYRAFTIINNKNYHY